MSKRIIFFTLLFLGTTLMSSCLKKITAADELNTNIFDRDYAGEQWYVILDSYQYSNPLGQIKARAEVSIPIENIPELRPSFIDVHIEGDGIDVTTRSVPQAASSNYDFFIDLPYDGMKEYCITVGIYVEEEDVAINLFEDCFTL